MRKTKAQMKLGFSPYETSITEDRQLRSWLDASLDGTEMGERRYLLRLFISVKHITANVMDATNGRIVATASTVEHAIKDAFDAKAAAIGEVLAMRLKTEGLGSGVHIDAAKEIQNKELHSCPKAWAIVNAMRSKGFHVVLPDPNSCSS